ncbi:hypothetical protein LTR95_004191 [Oleoguttula sp. CCFEE 5521]
MEVKSMANDHDHAHTAHTQHDGDNDAQQLSTLGYKSQLKRNFGFFSVLGLTTTVMATWEAFSVVFVSVLTNGGAVALIYGFIFCFIGTLATCLSLAEFASMSPTSAGQYLWAAELAPKQHRRFISWLFGWVTFWGWQLTTASPAFLAATIIQALLVLNHPDTYVYQRWHGSLIYWLITLLGVAINITFAKFLPKMEGFLFIWHVAGFFAVLIPLVYLGPQNTASFVFTSSADAGAWSSMSMGLAFCVGLVTSTFPFVGYDAAAHMSEEIKDAAKVVPRAMVATIVINGALGFAMIIALLFSMGDIEAVLEAPVSQAGYPFIQIYYQAVKSLNGTNAMVSVTLVIVIFANWGLLAGASRTTWAFARDRGLPASDYLAYVNPRSQLPVRSIILCIIIQLLLGLINIGSTAAFNAFVNSAAVTLYISYITPVVLGVWKRMRREPIAYGPFQLGRWRNLLNGIAIVYTFFTCIFLFFPAAPNPTPAAMNWSIVLVGAVFVFAIFWWFVQGRKTFIGPKMDVDETGHRAME